MNLRKKAFFAVCFFRKMSLNKGFFIGLYDTKKNDDLFPNLK